MPFYQGENYFPKAFERMTRNLIHGSHYLLQKNVHERFTMGSSAYYKKACVKTTAEYPEVSKVYYRFKQAHKEFIVSKWDDVVCHLC